MGVTHHDAVTATAVRLTISLGLPVHLSKISRESHILQGNSSRVKRLRIARVFNEAGHCTSIPCPVKVVGREKKQNLCLVLTHPPFAILPIGAEPVKT